MTCCFVAVALLVPGGLELLMPTIGRAVEMYQRRSSFLFFVVIELVVLLFWLLTSTSLLWKM